MLSEQETHENSGLMKKLIHVHLVLERSFPFSLSSLEVIRHVVSYRKHTLPRKKEQQEERTMLIPIPGKSEQEKRIKLTASTTQMEPN